MVEEGGRGKREGKTGHRNGGRRSGGKSTSKKRREKYIRGGRWNKQTPRRGMDLLGLDENDVTVKKTARGTSSRALQKLSRMQSGDKTNAVVGNRNVRQTKKLNGAGRKGGWRGGFQHQISKKNRSCKAAGSEGFRGSGRGRGK